MMRSLLVTVVALALSSCATPVAEPVTPQVAAHVPTSLPPGERAAPDGMRWLYASGEAAGASIQTWRQLADYAIAVSRQRKVPQSVPMGLPDAQGGIGTPSCVAADGTMKPFAAVFDVDETVLLNNGYEYWAAYSGKPFVPEEWAQWADGGAGIAAPVPGAVTGLRRLRESSHPASAELGRGHPVAGALAGLTARGGSGLRVLRARPPARLASDRHAGRQCTQFDPA
jgi:hypothetical protein